MPPKKQNTHQTSTRRPQEDSQHLPIIPIYQSLKNAEIADPIVGLTNRIEISYKENPQIVKRSLLIFIIRCCGLEDYAADFNFQECLQCLERIIERSYEQKLTPNNQPLIIYSKVGFHNQFIKRMKAFLQVLLSDDLEIAFDHKIQLLPSVLAWLGVLSKSKIRTTRSCAIQFLKYFVGQQLKYFNYLMDHKQSKKAFVISKNLAYFLQKVLCERINDVDSAIRETSITLIEEMLIEVQSQLLSQSILRKVFDSSINQKPKIIENVLQVILNLLEKTRSKKQIMKYLLRHLSNLEYLALSPNHNGVISLKILMQIFKIDSNILSLKPSIITKIFSNYSQQKYLPGLSLAIEVFFSSLYPSEQMIEINGVIVLTQILSLLGEMNNQKNIKIILRQFFVYHKKKADAIFSFEGMFNLLLSEYYRNGSEDILLNKNQLNMLAKTICEYAIFCQQRWTIAISEKQKYSDYLQTYNSLLLTASKEIFFQKIESDQYEKIAHNYLKMFSLIHLPIVGSLQSYIDFVAQRLQNIFLKDVGNGEIYKEIINIYSVLNIQQIKQLVQKIQIDENNDEILTKQNVYRISSIIGKYNIAKLLTPQMLSIYFSTISKASASSISIKIQIMTILKIYIQRTFANLIQNPTHSLANFYKYSRQKIIFLLAQILDNTQENFIVKLSCFKALLKIIQFVCHSRFEQMSSNMVHYLDEKVYKVIYGYVSYHFGISVQNQDVTLDVSRLMSVLSFQNLQIKEQMVKNLFATYTLSYTFACHPFSVKFMLYLLKKQAQMKENDLNKSVQYLQGFQHKTISSYFQELLQKYAYQESLTKNVNKFIYWRLCGQLLDESYDEAEHDSLMHKLIIIYFKKRLQTQNHKNLLNKLILFLVTNIDKIISRSEYQKIDIYQNILKKVYRRYDKTVLFRFKQYMHQKIQSINDPYLNQFLAYVTDISKIAKDNKKTKNKAYVENQESQADQQDQNDENKNQGANKMQLQNYNDKETRSRKNQPAGFTKRQTRSSMKMRNRADL